MQWLDQHILVPHSRKVESDLIHPFRYEGRKESGRFTWRDDADQHRYEFVVKVIKHRSLQASLPF